MIASEPKRLTPAYVAYKTFINQVNSLKESSVPSQFDRSMLGGMSGSAQSAILGSLEYLNLINKGGHIQPKFQQLIDSDENDRPAILREIVEASYPFLFSGSINLQRATTKQVEDEFRKQGVSGSTVVKCMAFFLSAAKAAGIQISPHVKTPAVPRAAGSKRSTPSGSGTTGADFSGDDDDELPPAGTKRLKLPIDSARDVVIYLPDDFSKDDWEFLEPILKAYIARLTENDPLK